MIEKSSQKLLYPPGSSPSQPTQTNAPSLPQEIRERRKLLWSGGLPKRNAKQNKGIPEATSRGSASAHAESCLGEVRSTYRLEVTDGGNAVLKLGDSEVVWKALSR